MMSTFWIYGLGLLYDTDSNYYLEDATGSMRFIANSYGSKRSSANYDPFGNIRSSSGYLTDFQFQTQQLDSGSNLYFLRARYYDPELGRFISRDPVKGTLTNPQTQNPYAYSLNNPVNLSDPSGEFIDTAWDIANIAYDIATCDWGSLVVDTVSAAIPFVPAGITKAVKVADKAVDAAKALNITFGHGARHLEGTGLVQDVVEAAIRSDIAAKGAGPTEELVSRTISVEGKTIEYHSYKLPDGTINVGTYFIP